MKEIRIRAGDGHTLVLVRSGCVQGPVVAITHGTFSGTASCDRLGAYLAAQGFGTWLFDWRGHGRNPACGHGHDLEAVARHDIASAIEAIRSEEQGRPLTLIGHSGGGIAAAIWAARNPDVARDHLAGVVLLAAQATHAASTPLAWARIRGYLAWIGRRNWLAANRMVGPEAESGQLMRQWCQWNLQRRFVGHDGMNYLQALSQVRIPVLAMAGAGDCLIAPWQGCEALASAFGGTDVEFVLCGKAAGFVEDYSHSRLLMAGNAQSDVFPRIAQWIRLRAEQGGQALVS